jgi:hypothetical protein
MLYVSLGCNCYVSWTLRKIGLQNVSYPFDWINFSSIEVLPNILEFSGFKNSINSWVRSDFPQDLEHKDKFICKKMFLRFPHEFDVDPNIAIEDIVSRYERRFSRLSADLRVNEVIFLRMVELGYGNFPLENAEVYKKNEHKIINSLAFACGHENFKLIIFSKKLNFDFEPTSPKITIIKGAVPFENGFYKYDPNYVEKEPVFSMYKNLLTQPELSISNNYSLRHDHLQKLHDSMNKSLKL